MPAPRLQPKAFVIGWTCALCMTVSLPACRKSPPMEGVVPAQKVQRSGRAIAAVACNGMAGQFGVPSDLVHAAGEGLALDQGIVRGMSQDPAACGAGHPFAFADGILSSSGRFGQRPAPFYPLLAWRRHLETAMDHCQVAFADGFFGELSAEMCEHSSICGQQHETAGVPVDAMNRMKHGQVAAHGRQMPRPYRRQER